MVIILNFCTRSSDGVGGVLVALWGAPRIFDLRLTSETPQILLFVIQIGRHGNKTL